MTTHAEHQPVQKTTAHDPSQTETENYAQDTEKPSAKTVLSPNYRLHTDSLLIHTDKTPKQPLFQRVNSSHTGMTTM